MNSRNRMWGGRLVRAAAVAAASAVALTACAAGGSEADPSDATPSAGGSLRVLLSAEASCIDPAVAFAPNERQIVRPLVDSLVSMDPETGEIEPWLAESWEVNEDATQYTFHLRDDATFSDGTPVDATAVKSTFDYLVANLLTTAYRGAGYLRGYTQTVVVDDNTARVEFSSPALPFLAGASTNSLGIVSTSSAEKTPSERCVGEFVGSGPFTLDEYTQGQTASLGKRDDYDWGPATAKHSGPAYLDAIEFQIVNVSNARAGSLQSGQADVIAEVASVDIPQLEQAGATVKSATQPGLPVSVLVNSARPGLTDPALTEALRTGFDRASAVQAVLGDLYSPATSVLTPVLPQYEDESALLEFDPEGAADALADAGWVEGSDGVREKDGVRAEFELNFTSTYGAYYIQMLQLFQQQMRDQGIIINLNDLLQADLLQSIGTHDYDFYVTSLTDVDPDIIRSTAVRILDQPALEAAGVMTLFEETTRQADLDERKANFAELQDLLIRGGFIVPLWDTAQTAASAANVRDLGMDFQGFLDFYDTSLAK